MLSQWLKKRVSPSTYRIFLTSRDLYRYSGKRNRAVLFIVILTAWMLTMLTGLIVNIDANWDRSQIRLKGTAAKVMVTVSGQKQMDRLRKQEQVQTAGLLYPVGTWKDFSICYADEICWEKIMSPAVGNLEGEYPQKENEILLSRACLREMDRENARLGDSVTIPGTGTFRLSGIFTDYAKEAGIQNLYVSQNYARKHHKLKVSQAAAMVCSEFVNYYLAWIIEEECGIGADCITLVENQFVGRDGTIIILKWILVLIFVCGGLSVYHIFFVAVSADQKSYGLLSVIGMSHRQIFLCMRFQGAFFAVPGIFIGGLAGILAQTGLVPWFMKRFMAADKQVRSYLITEVHVYPQIPVLAAVLICGMLFAGFAVVAWRICRRSPMECLRGISNPKGQTEYLQQRRQRKKRILAGRRRKRLLDSKTRIRVLAWQNQKRCFGRNFLTAISFLVSCNFFLVVHSLIRTLEQNDISGTSDYSQRLFCVKLLGDFTGVVVLCVAVISLCSISLIHMKVREPQIVLLQNIGMTRKQLERMINLEAVIQYLEFVILFVVLEIPVWKGVSAFMNRADGFSMKMPWDLAIGIFLITFLIYMGSHRMAWKHCFDMDRNNQV